MTWARLDDGMPDNPKVIDLTDAAFRAYVTSICYSAKHLTDGRVPPRAIQVHAKTRSCLVAANLWAIDDDGTIVIHDYLEWNPSKAEVLSRRQADLERKAAAKAKQNPSGIRAESERKGKRVPSGILSGFRASHPDPKEEAKASSAKKPRERDVIWDELEATFGVVFPGTSAHGKRNRAVRDLRLSGATPESIRSAHRKFQKLWPNILPTDTGLAKHYPQLVNGTIHAPRPDPEKGQVAEGIPDVLGEVGA